MRAWKIYKKYNDDKILTLMDSFHNKGNLFIQHGRTQVGYSENVACTGEWW